MSFDKMEKLLRKQMLTIENIENLWGSFQSKEDNLTRGICKLYLEELERGYNRFCQMDEQLMDFEDFVTVRTFDYFDLIIDPSRRFAIFSRCRGPKQNLICPFVYCYFISSFGTKYLNAIIRTRRTGCLCLYGYSDTVNNLSKCLGNLDINHTSRPEAGPPRRLFCLL